MGTRKKGIPESPLHLDLLHGTPWRDAPRFCRSHHRTTASCHVTVDLRSKERAASCLLYGAEPSGAGGDQRSRECYAT